VDREFGAGHASAHPRGSLVGYGRGSVPASGLRFATVSPSAPRLKAVSQRRADRAR